MKLISVQIALFSQETISRPDLVMNDINQKENGIFDDIPTIINLPPDILAEIPIAQIKSKTGMYNLNVSRNRVDLIVNADFSNNNSPFEIFKSYKPIIDKFYKAVNAAMAVIRIGIIMTLFEPTGNNVKVVYDKYSKETYSRDCTEVTYRINKQNVVKGHVINNIRNIEATDLHFGSDVHKGIIIQLDTNNVPDQNKPITAELTSTLLTQAINKIKDSAVKELI